MKWTHFDTLMIPLVITDRRGVIRYKNALAQEMGITRLGSSLVSSMDYLSRLNFQTLDSKGTLLTVTVAPYAHRCVALPFSAECEDYCGFLFPGALLGSGYNVENEELVLSLVPALRRMLAQSEVLPYTLGRSMGRKAANARLGMLMRKIMDVYLGDRRPSDETRSVEIDYFLSVLTYFFREVFKHQGVKLAVSETAAECEYEFLDHRNVVAMLLTMIELMIDRSGTDRLYIDLYSEAGQAVVMLSAVLRGEWMIPDDSLPDAYILFALLRRHGIEYEFYNTVNEASPRMICRLFLPTRVARPIVQIRSGKATDARLAVSDFLAYLCS